MASAMAALRKWLMDIEQLRKLCLSFPGVTEQIQWEDDLLFKVGGKMFAVTPLIPARVWISFKTSDEKFAELTERPGVIPAPYLARAKWIALESREALAIPELAQLLRESYELVLAKLPRKFHEAIKSGKSSKTSTRSKGRNQTRKKPRKTKRKN
jgi:predicted DNA-binding protein (MmcQ/YjbR family)